MNRFKKFLRNWFTMMLVTLASCTITYLLTLIIGIKFTFLMFSLFIAFITIVCILTEVICFIFKLD